MSKVLMWMSVIVLLAFNNSYAAAHHVHKSIAQPQLITNCQQLQDIGQNPSGQYALQNDINCADSRNWNNGQGFMPIENFSGDLNGNGKTVYNLYMNQPSTSLIGLIGNLSGTVENIHLEDVAITGVDKTNVGGLVATNTGIISNVSVNGVISTGANLGMIVGDNHGTIENATATGTLSGAHGVGGIAGGNSGPNAQVLKSSSSVKVQGSGLLSDYNSYVGGLVGNNDSAISQCFATGQVVGPYNAGGLVAWNRGNGHISSSYASGEVSGSVGGGLVGTNDGTISNTYAIGRVWGSAAGGGLLAVLNGGSVTHSYYNIETAHQHDAGNRGTPKTTAEMMQQATYVGWGFNSNVWNITQNYDYPRLQWQTVPLTLRILPIPATVDVGEAFPVTILANQADYKGRVYLSSTRGKVSPAYVDLQNGRWSGHVTAYTLGKRDYLAISWPNNEGNKQYSVSDDFDVLQNGTVPTNASVTGLITKVDGVPIVGANVRLYSRNPEVAPSQPMKSVLTDANGQYNAPGMGPGQYYVKVNADGYQTELTTQQLAVGRAVTYNVAMTPKACTEADFVGGRVPVLLVPGILGSTSGMGIYPRLPREKPTWNKGKLSLVDWRTVGWSKLRAALVAKGYRKGCTMFDVPYYWSLPIPEIRDRYLLPWIKKAKQVSGQSQVDIIAHSMGGLVVRSYIQSKSYDNDVRKLAMVGTPNLGAAKSYYIWSGGDPIKADKISKNTNGNGKYFYTNTIYYLYKDRKGEKICKFKHRGSDVPRNDDACDRDKIYEILHREGKSVGQLVPVYEGGLLKQLSQYESVPVPIVYEENTFLKSLDKLFCYNQAGCGQYHYNAPDNLFTNDSSGVQTKLFVGQKVPTLRSIYIKPNAASDGRYVDGIPVGYWMPELQQGSFMSTGDDTVLAGSVTNFMPANKALLYTLSQNAAKHSELIGVFKHDLAGFIGGAGGDIDVPPLRADDDQPEIMVYIDGRVKPAVTATNSQGRPVQFADGQIVTNYRLDQSAVTITNPVSGTYHITINASEGTGNDYEASIFYWNPLTDVFGEHRFLNDVEGPTATYTFTLHQGALTKVGADNVITLGRLLQSPRNVELTDDAGNIRVTWEDPVGVADHDVDHYDVYLRTNSQPYFHKVAEVNGTMYVAPEHWSDVGYYNYAVKAALKNDTQTVFSQPGFYIPPETP